MGGGGKKLIFFGVYLWQSKAAARFTTILAHPRNPQARGTLGWLIVISLGAFYLTTTISRGVFYVQNLFFYLKTVPCSAHERDDQL